MRVRSKHLLQKAIRAASGLWKWRVYAKVKVKSAHHEGVELVAVGIAEIGGIELRAALAGRTLAGGAERQRELVDAVNLLLVLGAEGGHYAVASCHRLAVEGQADPETGALALAAPGDQAVVG